MATHPSVLAWRIPGTGEPGGLLFMVSHRVGHDWSDLAAAAAAARDQTPGPCFGAQSLPWITREVPIVQATLFLPVSNCRCLQLSFHHLPCLFCVPAASGLFQCWWAPPKCSFILSTGIYRALSMCLFQGLFQVLQTIQWTTHKSSSSKNICLLLSSLFLEFQAHVAKCIRGVLLDIKKRFILSPTRPAPPLVLWVSADGSFHHLFPQTRE